VQVRVLDVNREKNQIALSMKGLSTGEQRSAPKENRPRKPRGQPRAKPERKEPPKKEYHVNPDGPKITAPAPRGPLPQPRADGAPRHEPRTSSRPGARAEHRPPAPKQIFNNAFAGLAALKDNLKK
jgi:hypothetical protein